MSEAFVIHLNNTGTHHLTVPQSHATGVCSQQWEPGAGDLSRPAQMCSEPTCGQWLTDHWEVSGCVLHLAFLNRIIQMKAQCHRHIHISTSTDGSHVLNWPIQGKRSGELSRLSDPVLWAGSETVGSGNARRLGWRTCRKLEVFVCSQALRTNQTDSARVNRIKVRVSRVCPSFPKEAYRPPARAGKVSLSPPPPKFFCILSDTSGHLGVIVLFYDRHVKMVHIKVSFCLCRNSIF